jgi:1-phosphofructokinase/tagatose 6-phosphate kinase
MPEGMEPDFYAHIIRAAAGEGVRTILDTSGEMLVKGVKASPFMVKPNRRELGVYAGKDIKGVADAVKASELMLSQGAGIVTASLGPDGAVMSSRDWCFEALSPDIDVVNTIGSGDSMVAGLAVAADRIFSGCRQGAGKAGKAISAGDAEGMLRLGMACALANTQFEDIGRVEPEMVERYLSMIKIRRIS